MLLDFNWIPCGVCPCVTGLAIFDSVIGSGGDQIHREFIVFDNAQVYPEYVIYFTVWYCTRKEVVDWADSGNDYNNTGEDKNIRISQAHCHKLIYILVVKVDNYNIEWTLNHRGKK